MEINDLRGFDKNGNAPGWNRGEFHVTARRHGDLYGHSIEHCDPKGCAGSEMRLGEDDPDVIVHGVYEFLDGKAVAEILHG